MMDPTAYEKAMRDATYHLQIEIRRSAEGDGIARQRNQVNEALPVTGLIRRVFRGDALLDVGDEVRFTVATIHRDVHPLDFPDGARIYLDFDRFIKCPYLEVFLNGWPPDLMVAAWQYESVEKLTEFPMMQMPAARIGVLRGPRRI